MVAGAMAGTVEHIAMYPVDTIKTRMQALSHPGQRVRAGRAPHAPSDQHSGTRMHAYTHAAARMHAYTRSHGRALTCTHACTRLHGARAYCAQLHGVSVYEAISKALRREGVRGLYKGVGAVAAGAGWVVWGHCAARAAHACMLLLSWAPPM